jgi:hypothetical protein
MSGIDSARVPSVVDDASVGETEPTVAPLCHRAALEDVDGVRVADGA